MSSVINTPTQFLTALQAIITGLGTALPTGMTQLTTDDKVTSIADLQTEFQGYAAVYQAAETATNAQKVALLARDKIASTVLERYEALRAAIKASLGKNNPNLTKFGLSPQKPRVPLTPAKKQAAAAKAKATRIARGTLGPKQKAAIKGTVPAATAVAAPGNGPVAPAPAPAPAPKAGS